MNTSAHVLLDISCLCETDLDSIKVYYENILNENILQSTVVK